MLVQFLAVKAEIDACLTVSRFLTLFGIYGQNFSKNAKPSIFGTMNRLWYSGSTDFVTLLVIEANILGFSQKWTKSANLVERIW